jgi:hypothetical protein
VNERQPRIFLGPWASGSGLAASTTRASTRIQDVLPYPRKGITWGTRPRFIPERTRLCWNQSSMRAARWMGSAGLS